MQDGRCLPRLELHVFCGAKTYWYLLMEIFLVYALRTSFIKCMIIYPFFFWDVNQVILWSLPYSELPTGWTRSECSESQPSRPSGKSHPLGSLLFFKIKTTFYLTYFYYLTAYYFPSAFPKCVWYNCISFHGPWGGC